MLARARCRSVAAHSNILGIGARRHQPTVARRSDAVYDLRAIRFVPFETHTPNDSTAWSVGRAAGFRCDFEDFSLPSSYRCYRRVVSCFKMLFVFPSVGLVWIWMVFPSRTRKREPREPPLGGGMAESSARAITRGSRERLFQSMFN